MKKKAISILMAGMMILLSACGTTASIEGQAADSLPSKAEKEGNTAAAAKEQKPDPYSPMEETVTITIGKELSASPKLGPDSSVEDNDLTRYISNKLNIKYVDEWQASNVQDAYKSKVSISLASGDIPDVLVVDRSQLEQMVAADLVEDLSNVYNDYASVALKMSYESTGGYSLASATFDGKLMGIPNVTPGADGINLVWIRQDWLDELNLAAPKTLDDLINIIREFKDKKGALGLLGNSENIVSMSGNSFYGFDTIFSSFDAYPQLWYENEQGEVVYGSVQPEVKTALTKLSEMYSEGLIDNEFAVKPVQQSDEAVASGKAGVVFGPWWETYMFGDSMTQDPNADWVPYLAPVSSDGKMHTHMIAPTSTYLVVKKGFSHPEAVIKTVNVQHDIDQMNVEQMKTEGILVSDPEYQWILMPFSILFSNYDDKEQKAEVVQNVIDGKTSPDTLQGEAVQIYQAYQNETANPKGDFYVWAQKMANIDACNLLNSDAIEKKMGVFYDQTETMTTKWANLKKLEDSTFLKIIVGSEPIESFDTFVTNWNEQGGADIVQEVAEATKG